MAKSALLRRQKRLPNAEVGLRIMHVYKQASKYFDTMGVGIPTLHMSYKSSWRTRHRHARGHAHPGGRGGTSMHLFLDFREAYLRIWPTATASLLLPPLLP